MGKRLLALTLTVVALAVSAACTMQQATVPPIGGPSELGLSLRVSVSPDSISQDGVSQSSIVVTAFDAQGKPKAGVAVRLDMVLPSSALCPSPCIADYGSFSARTIVTGSDGRATTVYTAPPPPPPTTGGSGTTVTIMATPTSANFQTAAPQFAAIRLVTPGVILPPASTPTAAFTWSPTPVNSNTPVTFDGSTSCPVPVVGDAKLCPSGSGVIVSYAWDFGDGGTGTGKTATHSFKGVSSFVVTLTVTNDRGVSASATQTVPIVASPAPQVDFVWSPSPVLVNSTTTFNADVSKAAAGHNIVQYSWDFGDGTTGANASVVSHKFTVAQTYKIVLTITDDAGQKATKAQDITVQTGNPTPVIVATLGAAGTKTVNFDGGNTATFGGATIDTATGYVWSFGDGTSASGITVSHTYASATSFLVRLTVTDSAGRTASTTVNVVAP